MLVIGDSRVGKTWITRKYNNESYNEEKEHYTNILEYFGLDDKLVNESVKLNIWDSNGEEQNRGFLKVCLFGAKGIIFVYDISNRQSFENLNNIINDLFDNANINGKLKLNKGVFKIILLGAKKI